MNTLSIKSVKYTPDTFYDVLAGARISDLDLLTAAIISYKDQDGFVIDPVSIIKRRMLHQQQINPYFGSSKN